MYKLAVLSCMLAVASASAIAPLGWTGAGWAGLAAPLTAPLAAPLAAPWAAPLATPLAAPLATPLAAPLTTHILHKRSAVLTAAPIAWTNTAGLAVSARLATPLAAAPLVGSWGSAPWGNSAAWGAARW